MSLIEVDGEVNAEPSERSGANDNGPPRHPLGTKVARHKKRWDAGQEKHAADVCVDVVHCCLTVELSGAHADV